MDLFLEKLRSNMRHEDMTLTRAGQFIEENACGDLNVQQIADFLGVSRSMLQRRFRAAYDKTVLEIILQVRIKKAKDLLQNTDLRIEEIARISGFKSRAYLGYVLKRETGTTALHHRQS